MRNIVPKVDSKIEAKNTCTFLGPTHSSLLLVGPALTAQERLSLEETVAYFSGPVILLDGAVNALEKKPKNAIVIGDGDSCDPNKCEWIDHLLPKEKNQSDLGFALDFHIPQKTDHLCALGLRGGRLDHELINLGELDRFLQQRSEMSVLWGENLWALAKGQHKFEIDGTFSLFALTPNHIKVTGDIQYPLQNWTEIRQTSLGLSNRANGEVRLESQGVIFLYHSNEGEKK